MKRKNVLFSIICVFGFMRVPTCLHAEEDISILLNNQKIESEKSPINISGTVYVPLRSVTEAMGCEVVWVGA